jgi:hypothetical protein
MNSGNLLVLVIRNRSRHLDFAQIHDRCELGRIAAVAFCSASTTGPHKEFFVVYAVHRLWELTKINT